MLTTDGMRDATHAMDLVVVEERMTVLASSSQAAAADQTVTVR